MDTAEPSVETLRMIDVRCDELAAQRNHVGLDPAPAAPSAPAHAAPAASWFDSGAYSSDSESARLDLTSETRACANSATKKAQDNGNEGEGEGEGGEQGE
jgi:hypothetical protein